MGRIDKNIRRPRWYSRKEPIQKKVYFGFGGSNPSFLFLYFILCFILSYSSWFNFTYNTCCLT